jgi:xanthine dehydrogenase YagR molybdenum-binding subunit
MKAKGVAELGICGVAAAVSNAVYNATGIRVREYPITLDKLLAGHGEFMAASSRPTPWSSDRARG